MGITDKIKKLKKEKNAVILAHNYQLPEIQDIADFVGDSLGLSIEAAKTNAAIIVFCGVHFMAETAKILSPQKTVLLPEKSAGCPMADMIDPDGLKSLQSKHPKAVTMCYVNSSAAVKALCDYCCTSANALKMTQKILTTNKEIIFVPDQYLAQYVATMATIRFLRGCGVRLLSGRVRRLRDAAGFRLPARAAPGSSRSPPSRPSRRGKAGSESPSHPGTGRR